MRSPGFSSGLRTEAIVSGGHHALGRRVGVEQGGEPGAQRGVVGAGLIEERGALRQGLSQRRGEEGFFPFGGWIHGGNNSPGSP